MLSGKAKDFESFNLNQLNEWEKNYTYASWWHFPGPFGNFLEIKGLVRLMVKAVSLQIQGKKAAEVCKIFEMDSSGIEELDDESSYLG